MSTISLIELTEWISTIDIFRKAYHRKILALSLEDDALIIELKGGYKIKLLDSKQCCCEKRYMHTDDDLQYYVGSRLTNIEITSAPDVADPDGKVHEVQFVKVTTTLGVFTLETHNIHNGYYGGFDVRLVVVDQ